MSDQELAGFLAEERTVTCATLGPRGWPHLMPLWYVLREVDADEVGAPQNTDVGEASAYPATAARIWAWTYASSQKVRNLQRDARATLQVEAGEQYQELRGAMFECDVRVHRELAVVAALGHEIFRRYAAPRGAEPVAELPAAVAAMIDKQAAKRVALEFVERRRASWDHRKLGGVY